MSADGTVTLIATCVLLALLMLTDGIPAVLWDVLDRLFSRKRGE